MASTEILDRIEKRVDWALARNEKTEWIIIALSVSIFALGAAILTAAYWVRNPYIASGAVLCQGLLYWPVREILRLRRENIALSTIPAMVSSLPPNRLAAEIEKLANLLRTGR